jgi:hypothetical protein
MPVQIGAAPRSEVLSVILLGIATVASAWCAYQAQLWSGEQVRYMAVANVQQADSVRKTTLSTRDQLVDVSAFINVVEARARGEKSAAAFMAAHARREFRPVLDSWLAASADGTPAPGTPFEMPTYRVAAAEQAARLVRDAAAALGKSNDANQNADLYVLHTVLVALALFFLGMTGQVRHAAISRAALTFGAIVLVGTLLSVARVPRAEGPPPLRALAPPRATDAGAGADR